MNILSCFSLILITINIISGQLRDYWFDQKWLDENYLLKWKTNHLEKVITFKVEVMTKGWVAFGLSKHGKTTEADVVIGWVDDWGHSTFNDYWVNEFGDRSLDMSQDWTQLSAEENATHTILEFSRHYVTCDEYNDIEIFENEFEVSNIFFAFALIDANIIESIGEPIVEGVFHLNFFETIEKFDPKETDIEFFDHWINVTLPPNSNIMHCLIFKNMFTEKHQIIKYQAISIPSYEQAKLNHHFVWSDCPLIKIQDEFIGKIFPCYDQKKDLSFIRQSCSTFRISTILNTEPVNFPYNTGSTIDPAETPYFLLEAHLINKFDREVEAKLSMRVWLTKQMRQLEFSLITFTSATGAVNDNWGFIVPPKQQVFKISYIVSSYCLENDQFKETGIHIFKAFFHSHHALSVEIKHYRNDRLIRVLAYNHHDYEWQPYRTIKSPINLRRGDKLVGFCDYSSILDTKSYTAPHEHCGFIAYYYPAIIIKGINEKFTYSKIPYKAMLKITGLKQIDGYDNKIQDNIIIRKPVKYNNTKLIDFISENKYKINDPKELEEFQISSDMTLCCFWTTKNANSTPCQTIGKPPSLYHTVMSNRKDNSCPTNEYLN